MRPILIVPGYQNSGPGHWQSLWEASMGARRVEMPNWHFPRKVPWVDALDEAVGRAGEAPILVAHALGCIAVAHWARVSSREVAAALLVAPADVERSDGPQVLRGFAPIPKSRLPFPSLLVASADDPHLAPERARDLAGFWGSRLRLLPEGGHLDPESGYGPWPAGEALLQELR
ncbi:MAG: serine hydrolase family protein [Acidobacteria bacterium]|nr:serine hydrolase family protein [Acidobacteriota bacterium]